MTEDEDTKIEVPDGMISVSGQRLELKRGHTVTALTEFMLAVTPDLKSDVERFVEQALVESDHVLRVIANDEGRSCADLGIQTGSLSSDQVKALANGILDDRIRDGERGFKMQTLVVAAFLASVSGWILRGVFGG